MQAILQQLLKIVLTLIALITTYFVGKGVITQPQQSDLQTHDQLQARVQALQRTVQSMGVPVAPTAPLSTTTSVGTDTSTTNGGGTGSNNVRISTRSSTGGSSSSLVAIGGANRIVVDTGTTQRTASSTMADTDNVEPPVMDESIYGAENYTPQPEVAGAFYVAPNGSDSNPGTKDKPWATLQHAAETLTAGQTVYVRDGTYQLTERVEPKNSGTPDAWITFAGYPGETVILDFSGRSVALDDRDYGAILISNGVSYIRIENLQVHNAQSSGISVCSAHHVDIIGNTTKHTFSSGINTLSIANNGCQNPHDVRILHNTIIGATDNSMAMAGYGGGEAPHEAISTMGVQNFEIAYNHIHDSHKEGIDVKENSGNGKVHHNLVENIARQCYYVDAGFGGLHDIEIYSNIGRGCGFMGFALSSENPDLAKNISFHHNLLYNNAGNGIYISRFGANGPRENVKIYKNTIVHSGHGIDGGWIGGGLNIYSANIKNVAIHDNIISDSADFQIAYAKDQYGGGEADLLAKNIKIENNLINGPQNGAHKWDSDMVPYDGINTIVGDPQFVNPAAGDFHLKDGSPAKGAATDGGNIGAF